MRPVEFPPFELEGLRTVDLVERPSKVVAADLGRPLAPSAAMADFLDSLPRQLAADSLRRLVHHLLRVHHEKKLAAIALGGHVIKTGCAPYLIDFMRRGVLHALALNGAAAIHDLELAVVGHTSEDVGPRLKNGTFGMARQTAELYAAAARRAQRDGLGLGAALADELEADGRARSDNCLLIQARRLGVPCTVHVAMGTDVVHMHPVMDPAALGAATMTDFRILTRVVSHLEGGLWINLGCAVVMPEVFLKAVSIVRNFGHSLEGMVAANLDMVQHYRGRVNVCERPGDEGILITGHHEIMVPLVHALVVARLPVLSAPAAGVTRPDRPKPRGSKGA